jgi:hypothetical protein
MSFETFVARERARLHADVKGYSRNNKNSKSEINRELRAIDAYEAAKSGRIRHFPRAFAGSNGRKGTVCPAKVCNGSI